MEATNTLAKTFVYEIVHPGERAAGIDAFTDVVTITIESGEPGGEPGEFAQFMRDCLADWYDGARVTLAKT